MGVSISRGSGAWRENEAVRSRDTHLLQDHVDRVRRHRCPVAVVSAGRGSLCLRPPKAEACATREGTARARARGENLLLCLPKPSALCLVLSCLAFAAAAAVLVARRVLVECVALPREWLLLARAFENV